MMSQHNGNEQEQGENLKQGSHNNHKTNFKQNGGDMNKLGQRSFYFLNIDTNN